MRADRHMNTETTHPPPPGVGIVDDDRELRAALRLLLESAGHVVETWADADACLAAMHPQRSGCLLLDLRLPGMSGLSLQKALHERGIELPVILLSGHADTAIAVRAMHEGAFDVLQKPCEPAVLLATVADAIAEDAARRQRRAPHERARQRLAQLSERERAVFDGIVAGRLNKSIAAELGLTESTIEVHRRNLMRKLGAGTLTELVQLHVAANTDGPDPHMQYPAPGTWKPPRRHTDDA